MDQEIFESKWQEMRGQIKEWWGELTDDDLEKASGNADQIIGILKQKYGYTREAAKKEFNRWLERVQDVDEKV